LSYYRGYKLEVCYHTTVVTNVVFMIIWHLIIMTLSLFPKGVILKRLDLYLNKTLTNSLKRLQELHKNTYRREEAGDCNQFTTEEIQSNPEKSLGFSPNLETVYPRRSPSKTKPLDKTHTQTCTRAAQEHLQNRRDRIRMRMKRRRHHIPELAHESCLSAPCSHINRQHAVFTLDRPHSHRVSPPHPSLSPPLHPEAPAYRRNPALERNVAMAAHDDWNSARNSAAGGSASNCKACAHSIAPLRLRRRSCERCEVCEAGS
jgi:hypothetical protein